MQLDPMRSIVLSGLEQTQELARRIAMFLQRVAHEGGVVVALEGELGSGKTTFVSMLADELGAKVPVSSPTYVLEHRYECDGSLLMSHWDLYRVNATHAPEELSFPPASSEIRIIEWASRSEDVLRNADFALEFSIISESERVCEAQYQNLKPEQRLELQKLLSGM